MIVVDADRDLVPRLGVLVWLASLAWATGDRARTEAYLVEALSWCAFADRAMDSVFGRALGAA
jgi:hypothetical protein